MRKIQLLNLEITVKYMKSQTNLSQCEVIHVLVDHRPYSILLFASFQR